MPNDKVVRSMGHLHCPIFALVHSAFLSQVFVHADDLPHRQQRDIDVGRQNLCDRARLVENGSLTIANALQGLHLSVGTGLWSDTFLTEDYTGMEADLLQELSNRVGFTWQYHFPEFPDFHLASVQNNLETHDLLTYSYWLYLLERLFANVSAVFPFLDGSWNLYVNEVQQEDASGIERWFQFADPFHFSVWLQIVGCLFATATAYLYFEHQNESDFPQQRCFLKLAESIFKAFLQVTGSGGYSPSTWAGKLIVSSWSWCVVLFISAYTANLASFLVSRAQVLGEFEDIYQVVKQGGTLCAPSGPAIIFLNDTFPTYRKIRVCPTEIRCFEELHERTCDGVMVPRVAFDFTFDGASKCSMKRVGGDVRKISMGWLTKADHTTKCSALISQVLNAHFTDMEVSGKLQEIKDRYSTDMFCEDHRTVETSNHQLGSEDMAGIFWMHGFCLISGVVIYMCAREERLVAKALLKEMKSRENLKDIAETLAVVHSIEDNVDTIAQNVDDMAQVIEEEQKVIEKDLLATEEKEDRVLEALSRVENMVSRLVDRQQLQTEECYQIQLQREGSVQERDHKIAFFLEIMEKFVEDTDVVRSKLRLARLGHPDHD